MLPNYARDGRPTRAMRRNWVATGAIAAAAAGGVRLGGAQALPQWRCATPFVYKPAPHRK